MASVPEVIPTNLPGRVIVRTGKDVQIPGAALLEGELAYTADTERLYIGNESNSPPWIPTNQYEGAYDWSKVDLKVKSLDVTNINGKSVSDFVSTTIINTGQVLTVIKEYVEKKVYGDNPDFPTLVEAYAWLSQRTISTQGFVVLKFPAGKIQHTVPIAIRHPNGDRIQWLGAAAKTAYPKYADLQVTGFTALQQAADTAANLNRLRQSYSTEIACSQGGYIAFEGNLGVMRDILMTSDGSVVPGGEYTHGINILGAVVGVYDCAVVGFDLYGVAVNNGGSLNLALGSTFYALGNGGGGIGVGTSSLFSGTYATTISLSNGSKHPEFGTGIAGSDGSLFAIYGFPGSQYKSSAYTGGNTGDGIRMYTCTFGVTDTCVSTRNGGCGINAGSNATVNAANCILTNNNNIGINAASLSACSVRGATITGNLVGIQALSGSMIDRTFATVSGNTNAQYSPALNVTGNSNALIY